MSFKTWVDQKKVKESDLVFTRALKNTLHLDLFHKVADQMTLFNPSFSEGLVILEWVTDLILMGHHEELFSATPNLESYKQHLKVLRFPEVTRRDEQLKSKMESWPWPQGSKVKFERRGDRAGVELKIFISSNTDMTKIMAALDRVQKEMSQ